MDYQLLVVVAIGLYMSLLSMKYMGVVNSSMKYMKWQLGPQPNRIVGCVLHFRGSDVQLMVYKLVVWIGDLGF